MRKPLILGISGASGLIYSVRILKFLLEANYTVDIVASKATYLVWQAEEKIKIFLDDLDMPWPTGKKPIHK